MYEQDLLLYCCADWHAKAKNSVWTVRLFNIHTISQTCPPPILKSISPLAITKLFNT
jgi:hypothetical protein